MAKEKKSAAADGGATRKQATETKKAATAAKPEAAPKTTKAAASTTKAAATTTKSTASTDKQSAAGGAATKKKAPAKPAGAGATSTPLIDTSLAAAAAANFVMNRALLGNSTPATVAQETSQQEPAGEPKPDEKRESSAFKQLKAGLNKPMPQGVGGLLGGAASNKKGNTGFGGGNQQSGRNQTFGADVNRAGIPRRTGG
jgi:hypothetical protein